MILRADEQANLGEIERDVRFRKNVKEGVKTAAAFAGGSLSAPMVSRVLPFLSEHIPQELAMKGIEKLSPKLGSFLKRGQQMGLDVKEGLNFIKEKIEPRKEAEPAKEEGNPIQKYSPNLFKYVEQLIRNGSKPGEAAVKAQKFLDKREQNIIKKIEKDYKTDWISLVESIFGSGDMGLPKNNAVQQEETQQPQVQGQSQNQNVDGAILAALQKIMQM